MDQSDERSGQQAEAKTSKPRLMRVVPIVVVVLMVVLGVVFASRPTPGSRTTTATSVRVVVSTAPGASTAEFPVALQEGGDPEHEADHIIEPLQGLGGISEVTLDWSSGLVLTVEFDPSLVTAQDIESELSKSGYLAQPTQ